MGVLPGRKLATHDRKSEAISRAREFGHDASPHGQVSSEGSPRSNPDGMDLREGSSTDARVADRDGAVLGRPGSAQGFPPRRCSRPVRLVPDDAPRKRHGRRLLLNAPLKDWIRIHGFDSATECEQAKAFWMTEAGYRSMLDEAAKRGLTGAPATFDAYQSTVRNNRCIASDDPRVAK